MAPIRTPETKSIATQIQWTVVDTSR